MGKTRRLGLNEKWVLVGELLKELFWNQRRIYSPGTNVSEELAGTGSS